MLTVHHLNQSRSQRVLWLLEELGVEYRMERYARDPKTLLAPPSLRKIHPLGKSPVITDGDETIAESGAIIEYLLERYGEGRFTPAPGSVEARRNRYFMHYAEGSLMLPLVMSLVFSEVRKKAPLIVRPIAAGIADQVDKTFLGPTIKGHVAMLEDELSDRTWITGESLAGADFQMVYPVWALTQRASRYPHPHVAAYLQRIEARPAYQRAIEKGGPLDIG